MRENFFFYKTEDITGQNFHELCCSRNKEFLTGLTGLLFPMPLSLAA